ncbi:MAG: TonB-dependent receptor, partial [Bacteroidales bacterium]|nr:TonB-dependent receptor [Bacteroidales bacterium]
MKKIAIVTFLTILVHYLSIGQETVVLSGFVTDATTGEEIIGANVYIDGTTTGTITNSYGYYSLNIPKSGLTIVYSFMGSETMKKEINPTESMKINVELQPASLTLNEVVVKGEKEDRNVRSVEMGVNKLSMKEAEEIPVIFGEKDIIKTIQLMPGIRSSSEASSGFNVRGGGSDQNLILLDEAPVYNASHLMGFFSVFNSDALKDVKMMKGTAPAEYGGRLSSVLDVKMKEGNSKNISTSGGIGLISSRATVEGPINEGKGSFIVSGRRTYADLLLKAFTNDYDDYQLYFYDLNAKANYRISGKDRIFISGYFGRDILGVSDAFGFDWGNKTATVRWNHIFGDRLFSNTSFIYSKYDYQAQMGDEASILSSIEDFNLKTDFQYFVNPTSTVRFGLNGIKHGFVPGKLELENRPEENEDINKNALEGAAYISHDISFGERIKINYGLRYSVFNEIGPGEYYTFNEQGDVLDTISYADADPIVYHNFEPRFSLNYTVDKSSSIKAAYARNSQYLHILSNTSGGSPFDVYI